MTLEMNNAIQQRHTIVQWLHIAGTLIVFHCMLAILKIDVKTWCNTYFTEVGI